MSHTVLRRVLVQTDQQAAEHDGTVEAKLPVEAYEKNKVACYCSPF